MQRPKPSHSQTKPEVYHKTVSPVKHFSGNGIKIKTYRLRRSGLRGLTIHLPAVWIEDTGLKAGDSLDLYRTKENHLYIVAGGKK